MITMPHIINSAVNMPGITPAANNLPIFVSVMMPYITMMVDGGIMMPRVPPAAITPVDRLSLYPNFFMLG